MKTIYKYAFPVCNPNSVAIVQLPKDAEVIRLDVENGHPFLWAIVDTEKPVVSRQFFLHKTGSDMDGTFEALGIIEEDYDSVEYWMRVNYLGGFGIWAEMELMLYVFDGGEIV